MRQELTHLVLTRFNTAAAFAPSAKRLDTVWLTSRLAIFERYCLPSVRGQRGAEFRWLIFFDAASPEWFRARISALGPLVTPLYIDGPATDEVIARKVAETGLVSSPFLLTTRLDNDDAISEDHLALVQGAFRRQQREFVAFPFGLQSFRGHLYSVYWPSNPFLSLFERVESSGRFTTVFCVRHNRVREAGKVRRILRSPQWLQVLHESNLLNTLRGWPRLDSRSHPNFRVAWPEETAADSISSRLRFSAHGYMMRAGRLIAKSSARRSSNFISGEIHLD